MTAVAQVSADRERPMDRLAGRFGCLAPTDRTAIGIWLVMKTTGAWSNQQKDSHPSALATDYSIFLIGTALSVGLGVGTAFIIQHFLPIIF